MEKILKHKKKLQKQKITLFVATFDQGISKKFQDSYLVLLVKFFLAFEPHKMF